MSAALLWRRLPLRFSRAFPLGNLNKCLMAIALQEKDEFFSTGWRESGRQTKARRNPFKGFRLAGREESNHRRGKAPGKSGL